MMGRLKAMAAMACLTLNAVYITLVSRPTKRIPNSVLHRLVPKRHKLIRHHPTDFAKPVRHVPIPQHPHMGPSWGNNMHCDSYISDTYEASGPLGINPRVHTRTEGFGGYGTITFDSHGRLVVVYSNGRAFRLELLDPDTLDKLAAYSLPPRPLASLIRGPRPWEYLGAGIYFCLDGEDRAVIPTTRDTIQIVQVPPPGSDGGFELVREYDLSGHLAPGRTNDSAAWVVPEWSGEYYWYATTEGVVGMLHKDSGAIRTHRLEGELIENAFAVGEDGVFIISDQAMYRFARDGDGPVVVWRTQYSKATQQKAGHISVGSGASVTLTGTPEDGMVVITDNAQPRINLLFIKRSDGALVGSVPVFKEGESGTDLTVIGFEHADENGKGSGVHSAIVENNWGHHAFPFSYPEPGLTRVDLTTRSDGSYGCEAVWSSRERTIGGFRLSFGNGLVYQYGREGSGPNSRWYFIASDVATGETVYKALAGTGMGYNNWSGSLFIGPQGGVAYSTTIFGMVMLRDTEPD